MKNKFLRYFTVIILIATLLIITIKCNLNAINNTNLSSNILFVNIKSILEALSYVVDIILLITLIVALTQLKLSKEELEITRKNSEIGIKREAATITAEQCKNFYINVVPKINAIIQTFKDCKIEYYRCNNLTFALDDDTISYIKYWYNFNQTNIDNCTVVMEKIAADIRLLINDFEVLSIFFTSGICNEEIAFGSISIEYINAIENILYPHIISCRLLNFDGYINIENLYKTWKNRINKINLQKQQSIKERELANIINTTNSIPDEKFNPIGL